MRTPLRGSLAPLRAREVYRQHCRRGHVGGHPRRGIRASLSFPSHPDFLEAPDFNSFVETFQAIRRPTQASGGIHSAGSAGTEKFCQCTQGCAIWRLHAGEAGGRPVQALVEFAAGDSVRRYHFRPSGRPPDPRILMNWPQWALFTEGIWPSRLPDGRARLNCIAARIDAQAFTTSCGQQVGRTCCTQVQIVASGPGEH